MPPVVAIQQGHYRRTRGSTGTRGFDANSESIKSEQAFVSTLAPKIAKELDAVGLGFRILTADEKVPPCDVFVALHQDGSTSDRARGASFGYADYLTNIVGRRANTNDPKLAAKLKAYYTMAGWPPTSGFRRDNFTRAMRRYYAWRSRNVKRATAAVLIEHGFATNVADQYWMWGHLDEIARSHAVAIDHFLTPATATTSEEDGMFILYDAKADTYRVVVPGIGSTIIEKPGHWQKVIREGRRTGTYSSQFMSDLLAKLS